MLHLEFSREWNIHAFQVTQAKIREQLGPTNTLTCVPSENSF